MGFMGMVIARLRNVAAHPEHIRTGARNSRIDRGRAFGRGIWRPFLFGPLGDWLERDDLREWRFNESDIHHLHQLDVASAAMLPRESVGVTRRKSQGCCNDV